MRTKLLLTLILSAFVMIFSISPATADDPFGVQDPAPAKVLEIQGQGSEGGTRLMVVTDGPVTEEMLAELRKFGSIHGIINTYNIVALTLKGNSSQADVENLSFVVSVVKDQLLYLTGIGMWDRDMINAVDVEETGPPFGEGEDPVEDDREVTQTGAGVHVAIVDSGLPRNWRDFLDEDQVATDLARTVSGGITCEEKFVDTDRCDNGKGTNPGRKWEQDQEGHGLDVASHVIGFTVNNLFHDGVAPGATIIPLRVTRTHNSNQTPEIWESAVIAAIDYVTQLKINGDVGPVVINLSLGGPVPIEFTRNAILRAIDKGVIVVASAGNEGEAGMLWPGAFAETISVGAVGWTEQFQSTSSLGEPNQSWWLLEDIAEPTPANQVFVTPGSSRALSGQFLDVLAPGENTVVPDAFGDQQRRFVSGTSFSAPIVSGVVALMLEKNGGLTQGTVEGILTNPANVISIPNSGTFSILLRNGDTFPGSWDDCGGNCNAVGAGLVQANLAVAATP